MLTILTFMLAAAEVVTNPTTCCDIYQLCVGTKFGHVSTDLLFVNIPGHFFALNTMLAGALRLQQRDIHQQRSVSALCLKGKK